MTVDELYGRYNDMLKGINVTPSDDFVFDLTDDNSQNSLKRAFPGIDAILMPECGNYLVVAPLVEDPNCLMLLFPSQSDGSCSLKAFNAGTKGWCDLTDPSNGQEKLTIDNFKDFANMEDIARRFNEFVFCPGKGSPAEVKDIGSIDITHAEPVEIPTTTTTSTEEENEMKFKPIQEDTELDRETKWVEIPNTNAGGVTVTEDDDPFAGEPGLDPNAPAPEGGDAAGEDAAPAPAEGEAPADAGTEAAPAEPAPAETPAAEEPAAEAPAEDKPAAPAETIDDPKAKMRELLAYYTNYMTELVNDPNTSTELISATQEMIDSLIKNMESADGIEEVKAEAEEAAKEEVSAEEAPAEETPAEEAPAEEAPAEDAAPAETPAEDAPVAEATDEQAAIDAKIDAEVDDLHKDDWEDIQPATSDNILTPGDLNNSPVNDVALDDVPPTPDEELAATQPDLSAPAPTSEVLDDTELPTPDEEVDLLGADDYTFGADGLPLDKFEGDIDALTTSPVAKKVSWSTDYSVNGIATSDDNSVVVPEVLKELSDYYKKVADEVSKVPGKEDVAMKLQKIQVLSQTIANEWNGILPQIGDAVANSYDLGNMYNLEKDELASQDAMGMVGADVMADQEEEEEDELAINDQIAAFCESFKHLM